MDVSKLEKLRETFPSLLPLNGKKPFETGWQRWCEEIRPFNPQEFNGYNAGIPCGPANGALVLDVDDIELFNVWLKEKGFKITMTRVHYTGGGKPHYIYKYPQNGGRYGCRAVKGLSGESIFDIRGIGGQVVGPGSLHPETGLEYTVRMNAAIAPAPEWLLNLAKSDESPPQAAPTVDQTGTSDIEALPIAYGTKKLIREGEATGRRSEAIMSVLNALVRAHLDDQSIIGIFEAHPNGIGKKYFEARNTRQKWLLDQVKKVRNTAATDRGSSKRDIAATVKAYLLDEFDGGVFKLSDLRKELGLNDHDYTLARQCIKRMADAGTLQKHGHQMGCYRVVDRKKKAIDFEATEAGASQIILPGRLHEIVTIRDGDMVCVAGYKNQNKTALAVELARLNLDLFKIHFFVTEYPARMKRRLIDFGIDFKHPNFQAYPIEKSDYIPDKIEPGRGVLNIIDHYPNVDNFYLVGKVQDEIHRALNGAICVITHQKLNEEGKDAIGGSFWTITPTLAVTLFYEEGEEYRNRMHIRKGKEPAAGKREATGLNLRFKLIGGCRFEYDPRGWF